MVLLTEDEVNEILGSGGGNYHTVGMEGGRLDEFEEEEHTIIFTHPIEKIEFGDEDLGGVVRAYVQELRKDPKDRNSEVIDTMELPELQAKVILDGKKEVIYRIGNIWWSFKRDEFFYNRPTRELLYKMRREDDIDGIEDIVGTKWHTRCFINDDGYKDWEFTYEGRVDLDKYSVEDNKDDEEKPKTKKKSKPKKEDELDAIIKGKIEELEKNGLLVEDDIQQNVDAVFIMIRPSLPNQNITDAEKKKIKEKIKKLL